MKPVWILAAALIAVAPVPRALSAQSADALLAQGIRAYQQREYAGGAWLLRRAIATPGLSPAETLRALTYLAAIELARDQRDSAVAAAQQARAMDARYRPDERVFSQDVVALFDDAPRGNVARRREPPPPRAAARAEPIAIRAVGDSAFRPGSGAFLMRLTAPAPAEVSATLAGPDGRGIRTLFTGPVRDSIDIRWNGMDLAGNVQPEGDYTVLVAPVGRDRRAGWSLRLPLEVSRTGVDTQALPPPPADSLFRPERGTGGRAWSALAPGLLVGAAIVVLPGIVAEGEEPSSGRLVIGGAITLAGLAAFITQRSSRSLDANSAYNRALRERWRRDVADISRRNAERARQSLIIIRAGTPVYSEGEGEDS